MSFVVKGLDSLNDSLEHLALMPDKVYDEMLFAAADVVAKEVSQKAETMLQGPYYTGDLATHVKHGKIRVNAKNGRYTDVIFAGNVVDKHHPHGERRTTIAFINEYGKKKQPARPFIRYAVDDSTDPAINAAADIYFAELEKIF